MPRTGRPPIIPARLDEYVDKTSGCWLWTGYVGADGYARVHGALAHRRVYESLVGPIADGLDLDHECHNRDAECAGGRGCRHRRCVNPAHLAPKPRAENLAAGRGLVAAEIERTECPAGHPYSGANLIIEQRGNGRVSRRCRSCKNARQRKAA